MIEVNVILNLYIQFSLMFKVVFIHIRLESFLLWIFL